MPPAILLGFLLAGAYVAGHEARETFHVASENGQRPALIALERRARQAAAVREAARAMPQTPRAGRRDAGRSVSALAAARQRRHALVATGPARQAAQQSKVVAASAGEGGNPVEAAVIEPAPAQRGEAQPSPSPTATQLSEVPNGGWGQNFANPLLADESALDDLRAKYHGSASVQVDESGHAVKVVINGALSADARAEIEKRLMALRYVPAECNGLRCGGTLQLTL